MSFASGQVKRPNSQGVFAEPTTRAQLLQRIGHGREELAVLGKRLLLLLETQPVYGARPFEALIDALVDRYAADYVASDPRKEWTFLLNDLIRYFRSICVHYQSTFDSQVGRGFRPHVTLGWEVTPAVWGGCHDGVWSRQRDGAWVSAIALGQYPDSWPGGGTPVSLVRVAPLGPPPR